MTRVSWFILPVQVGRNQVHLAAGTATVRHEHPQQLEFILRFVAQRHAGDYNLGLKAVFLLAWELQILRSPIGFLLEHPFIFVCVVARLQNYGSYGADLSTCAGPKFQRHLSEPPLPKASSQT